MLSELTQQHKDPELHQLLAKAEEGSGIFAQAAKEYQLAADGNPSEENLFSVGYELILAGSPAEAAESFQLGLKRYPRSITLLIGAGAAEFLQGKAPEGLQSFLLAVEIDPADPRPYPFLVSASGVSGADSERVRASCKRFLEAAPDNPQANYFYALSLWNTRSQAVPAWDPGRVEALLKRAIQLNPDFAKAYFQLAELYSERSDFPGAIQEYQSALRLDPELNAAHYRLASAYRHTGRMQQSSKEMQLFEETHQRETSQSAAGTISIEQFVSVIAPQPPHADAQTACSEGRP
jgi:tetratricopeptide (TPR) repeat protein